MSTYNTNIAREKKPPHFSYTSAWKLTLRNSLSLSVVLLVTLLSGVATNAQKPYTPTISNPLVESWRWHTYKEIEGKKYNCMVEDKDGSIWIGHEKGICKYNGISWQYFPELDSLLVPITTLFKTANGAILAGSSKAVLKYENNKWTTYYDLSFLTDVKCDVIGQSHDGDIWIGTNYGALRLTQPKPTLYTRNKTTFKNKELSALLNIVFWDDLFVGIEDFDGFEGEKTSTSRVFFFYTDSKKHFWFSTGKGYVIESTIQKENDSFKIHSFRDNLYNSVAQAITETLEGEIWIVYDNSRAGLSIYRDQKWQQTDLQHEGGTNINTSIIQTPDSTIWIGGFKMLHQIKNGKIEVYKNPDVPIPSSRLHLMYSKSGAVWIAGVSSDVMRFSYGLEHYATLKGLNYQCDDNAGRQWFISHNGAVVFYDTRLKKWGQYTSDDNVITAPVRLVFTRTGLLIGLGSENEDAAICVLRNGIWQKKSIKGLMWGLIERGFYEALDGKLWFGSATPRDTKKGWMGGMALYEPAKVDLIDDNAWVNIELPFGGVCLFGEVEANKYILGWKTLSYYQNDSIFDIQDIPELGNTFTEHLVANGDGEIWTATRGSGVYHVKDNKLTIYTVDNDLSSNNTGWVLPALDHTIWVGTPKGISRFDGRQWTKLVLPKQVNIEPQYGSVMQSKDSSIWINNTYTSWTKRALLKTTPNEPEAYRTLRYRQDSKPPETKITIFENEVSQPGNAIFEWKAVDYWQETESQDIQFSYRLDDGEWSLYTSETSKIFLSVSEGKHTLEVKARDLDFNEDPTPDKVSFVVTPPVYKTWWFILLITSFSLFIILFIVQMKVNNRKQALFINELEEQKELILQKAEEIQQQSEEIMFQRDQMEVQLDEIAKQNANLHSLSSFGQSITSTFNLHSINTLIYEQFSQRSNVSSLGIGLFYPKTQKIEFVYFIDQGEVIPSFFNKLDQENSLASWCVRTANEIIINDYESERAQYIKGELVSKTKENNKSLVYLPLKSKDAVGGVLTIQSVDANAFSETNINNFRVIASYLAIAIDNSEAYTIINQQKEQVFSSIKYAQTIQNAILPTDTQIADYFDFFNVYRPKDIVSGDFYWMSEGKNEHGEYFFAMADCTGHGVPGAFMSVIGSQLLGRIINERRVYSPAQILEDLDKNLRTVLMQAETQNNDGMDIMVCKFRKLSSSGYEITYSGAKSAMIEYQAESQECVVHKGTSRKIGGARKNRHNILFEEQSFVISANDQLFMYTDGIIDLTKADRKRFGTLRLIDFLKSISQDTTAEKEAKTITLIEEHLKESAQRDDIAIIGLKPRC